MDEFDDDHSDLDIDEATWQAMNAAVERPLSPGALEFGSDAYILNYRQLLVVVAQDRARLNPRPFQLDVSIASHLGFDVFLHAGTGLGKTLTFLLNCMLDRSLLVFLISPLNALANQQAASFNAMDIPTVAVNATTKYKGLKNDIIKGRYQVVISSIEAFTDTTRLLPIVQSPELAARGPQMVVIDEAHCIASWGRHFRSQYSTIGDLKLSLTCNTPFLAATATANNATRLAIEKSLRFGPDSKTFNLGNHKPNLAYSVHRMKKAAASINELLDYFPSKSEIKFFTLVFVDSKKLGQAVLHMLREHFDEELQSQIHLYHSERGDFDKKVLSAGFEKENGFKIIICTEALALGVDYLIVKRVYIIHAPSDTETAMQRGGRSGRQGDEICEVVILVQDSLFEDSKAGQKRLERMIKQEDEPKTRKAKTPAKIAKPTHKEYSDGIIRFINATGCRVKVLDEEFDNPPHPGPEICHCDNCRRARGEKTYHERMLSLRDAARGAQTAQDVREPTGNPVEQVLDPDEAGSSESESEKTPAPGTTTRTKRRPTKDRQPYVDALNDWVELMYTSPECLDLDITKNWILTEKMIQALARHLVISTLNDLKQALPGWVHTSKWGAELVEVIRQVNQDVEEAKQRAQEAKELAREAKRRAPNQRRPAAAENTQIKTEEVPQVEIGMDLHPMTQLPMEPVVLSQAVGDMSGPSTSGESSRPAKRQRIVEAPDPVPQNPTPKSLKKTASRAATNKRYRENKKLRDATKTEPSETPSQPGPPPNQAVTFMVPLVPYNNAPGSSGQAYGLLQPPGTSHTSPVSTPNQPYGLSRVAKEEMLDNYSYLLSPSTPLHPTLPHTPYAPIPSLQFEIQTPEGRLGADNQLLTPRSLPPTTATTATTATTTITDTLASPTLAR